jgi:hypothetical protein
MVARLSVGRKSVPSIDMEIKQLVSIALFTCATVLTFLSWSEYIGSKRSREGFVSGSEDILSNEVLQMISKTNEPVPTDLDAVQAHQTLLRYIRNDVVKGSKFIADFRDRFFGSGVPLRRDIDVRTIMDNYQSPLQRV